MVTSLLRPIDAAFINTPYLPGRRKAPEKQKKTRLPHTDRRAQPAPKQRKPTSSSEHNQDPKPLPDADPSYSESDSDEDDKDEPLSLIPHADSDSGSEEPPPPPTTPTTSNAPAHSGTQNQTEGGCPFCDYQSSDAESIPPHPPPPNIAPSPSCTPPQQPHTPATEGPRSHHSNLHLDIRRITAAINAQPRTGSTHFVENSHWTSPQRPSTIHPS